jgi:dTDP-4-amino-4,6-dideoxygalactose transaminase
MDPNRVYKAITERTRAIIPVHLFGQPCNMSRILETAGNNELAIIEDSCETMFAHHYDQSVGSMGDIGCFSTYVAHLVVTGVGGICTTNNSLYAGKMRSIVNHGLELQFLSPGNNFAPGPAVGRRFKFDTIGHSYRITEMEAALGLAQLSRGFRNNMLMIRKRNARHLTAGLRIINDGFEREILHAPKVMPGNTHSWMMYPILLERGMDKEPLMKYLNERQIETRDMLPILKQPAYQYLDPEKFQNSKWILESGFYVGCHQDLEPDDIQYVLQEIGRYLKGKIQV